MSQEIIKRALITGAAKRLGRAMALELASAGWEVVLHYKQSGAEAEELADEIGDAGGKAYLAEIDLAQEKHVRNLIPALVDGIGPMTALINNASLFEPDHIDGNAERHAARHWAVNVDAPRLLSAAFKDQLLARGGVILNLLDADPTKADFRAYNRSKIALAALTMQTAKDYAPNCRVNGLALGPIVPSPRESREHFDLMLAGTPLRTPIAATTVAQTARFLIETPSITGCIIPVDNGLHLIGPKNSSATDPA